MSRIGVVFVEGLHEFLRLDLLQGFALPFKVFHRAHAGFGHAFMGFFGSADQGELIRLGQSFVSIFIIKAYAQ